MKRIYIKEQFDIDEMKKANLIPNRNIKFYYYQDNKFKSFVIKFSNFQEIFTVNGKKLQNEIEKFRKYSF